MYRVQLRSGCVSDAGTQEVAPYGTHVACAVWVSHAFRIVTRDCHIVANLVICSSQEVDSLPRRRLELSPAWSVPSCMRTPRVHQGARLHVRTIARAKATNSEPNDDSMPRHAAMPAITKHTAFVYCGAG